MEEFVDLDAIHIFLTQNPIPTLLADTYYFIHVRTQKKKGTIVCYTPLLYRWFISHLPSKGPFIENKDNLKWSQRIMSLNAKDISWYSRIYDIVKLILNCGNFPNVPLLGMKGGINYNPRLALRRLGYPMVDKPDLKSVEGSALYEGVEDPELVKKIVKVWGVIFPQGREEIGKKNCISKEAYTKWVKDRVSEILWPFSLEPSMSIKPLEAVIHQTSKVDELKRVIKALEKENVDLKSRLCKISLEKETLKFNLNQKRDKVHQADDEVQTEFDSEEKIVSQTQYQACKAELSYREHTKKLRDMLEACKKELEDEQIRTKHLEVILLQNQYEINQILEEIYELKA
ncbi:uncharacterized protein LOC127081983 [Lathyrus oleraceus]|uniref:uncharacterized protein LOC127081983 n=1 Tax=Pisum sativum TaxID=3888 RepID=UPI0021D24984|nr:uncharacterized protein LOC127081983 [Pisum sativum]